MYIVELRYHLTSNTIHRLYIKDKCSRCIVVPLCRLKLRGIAVTILGFYNWMWRVRWGSDWKSTGHSTFSHLSVTRPVCSKAFPALSSCFTPNKKIIYKMNYMLYSLRHKTSNGDHKLIRKMFIEVIEKGASSHRLLYNGMSFCNQRSRPLQVIRKKALLH